MEARHRCFSVIKLHESSIVHHPFKSLVVLLSVAGQHDIAASPHVEMINRKFVLQVTESAKKKKKKKKQKDGDASE